MGDVARQCLLCQMTHPISDLRGIYRGAVGILDQYTDYQVCFGCLEASAERIRDIEPEPQCGYFTLTEEAEAAEYYVFDDETQTALQIALGGSNP